MARNVKSHVFFLSRTTCKEENSRTGLISHMFLEGKRFLYSFYMNEKVVILLKLHTGYLDALSSEEKETEEQRRDMKHLILTTGMI